MKMHETFIFLALLATLVGSLLSPALHKAFAAVPQEEHLVALWLFDEGKGDIAKDSKNRHDGQISNAKWVEGKFGKALKFLGAEVTVPHADDLTLQDHTISLWAKVPKITGDWQELVVKQTGGPLRNYGLFVDKNNGAVHYGFSSGKQWKSGTANTPITDGKWHFIAQTYNIKKQDFRLYVDGTVDFQRGDGSKPDTNNVPVKIGGTRLVGTLDEVVIFNVGLKEKEVLKLMEGLANLIGAEAVKPKGKLSTIWGLIKKKE